MFKSKDPRVEAPLLRAYLRTVDTEAPFAIHWPTWASWVLFAALTVAFSEGCLLWIVLAIAAPHIARNLRPPRNEVERLQNETYRAIRKLRWLSSDGRIKKRMLPEILDALERATSAHHAARARISAASPLDAPYRLAELDDYLHACFRIAAPTARQEEQSRREWNSVVQDKGHMAAVVDAIEAQRRNMELDFAPNSERLAALRELEADLAPVSWVAGAEGADHRFNA